MSWCGLCGRQATQIHTGGCEHCAYGQPITPAPGPEAPKPLTDEEFRIAHIDHDNNFVATSTVRRLLTTVDVLTAQVERREGSINRCHSLLCMREAETKKLRTALKNLVEECDAWEGPELREEGSSWKPLLEAASSVLMEAAGFGRTEKERLTTELVKADIKSAVKTARKSLEGERPYWAWRAMLEHLAKLDCEIGCCAESGECITEYCAPCAATQFLAEEIAREQS